MGYVQSVDYYSTAGQAVPQLGVPQPPSQRDMLESFIAFKLSEFPPGHLAPVSKLAGLAKRYPGLFGNLLAEGVATQARIREREEGMGQLLGGSEGAVRRAITKFITGRKEELPDKACGHLFPERGGGHLKSYEHKRGTVNAANGFPTTLAAIFETDCESE